MSWDGFILDEFRREVMAELGLRPYVLAPAPGSTASVSPALLEALARVRRTLSGLRATTARWSPP